MKKKIILFQQKKFLITNYFMKIYIYIYMKRYNFKQKKKAKKIKFDYKNSTHELRKSWKALSSLITIQHPSWKTHDPRWSRIEIRCHISKGNALLCAQRRMQKKDRSTVRHIVGSIQWRRNLLNRSRRDNDDSTIQENPLPSLFSFLSKNIEMSRVEF